MDNFWWKKLPFLFVKLFDAYFLEQEHFAVVLASNFGNIEVSHQSQAFYIILEGFKDLKDPCSAYLDWCWATCNFRLTRSSKLFLCRKNVRIKIYPKDPSSTYFDVELLYIQFLDWKILKIRKILVLHILMLNYI